MFHELNGAIRFFKKKILQTSYQLDLINIILVLNIFKSAICSKNKVIFLAAFAVCLKLRLRERQKIVPKASYFATIRNIGYR